MENSEFKNFIDDLLNKYGIDEKYKTLFENYIKCSESNKKLIDDYINNLLASNSNNSDKENE